MEPAFEEKKIFISKVSYLLARLTAGDFVNRTSIIIYTWEAVT